MPPVSPSTGPSAAAGPVPSRARGSELRRAALWLGVAAVIGWGASSGSSLGRLANLDLDHPLLPDVYVEPRPDEAGRCRVTGRRGATLHRDEAGRGSGWDCESFPWRGERAWRLHAKRAGTGTVFLVPVRAVRDWSAPLLHEFVRAREPELHLPEARWVQLFVARRYQGVALRMALPFDARRREGGPSRPRELVLLGTPTRVVDTAFEEAAGIYREAHGAEGLPALVPPSPALAWLARHRPGPEQPLLLTERGSARLLPLPLSLVDLADGVSRNPIREVPAPSLPSWREPAWAPTADSFPGAERAALHDDFERAGQGFLRGLRADGRLRGDEASLLASLPERQAAAHALALDLGTP